MAVFGVTVTVLSVVMCATAGCQQQAAASAWPSYRQAACGGTAAACAGAAQQPTEDLAVGEARTNSADQRKSISIFLSFFPNCNFVENE